MPQQLTPGEPDDRADQDDEPIVVMPDPPRRRGKSDESYKEARTRREIAAADREEYNRDIAKIDRDERRGKLVTAKEAKAAAAEVRDAFLAVGKQLWTRTDVLLGDLPASEKQRIAAAQSKAWADLLGELSL